MEIRPHRKIKRRVTKEIKVGKVGVGGTSQITVQSMTNTLTTDIKGTVNQIHSLEEAGADIVRVSCPDEESTKALKHIAREISVPLVADIHFHYKRAIEAAEMGASCLRINPGNIGTKARILEIVKEPLVSIDFNHNPASSIIDASLTNVVGKNMGKISAWYDNEWGFSNRMCDIAEYLHKIS